MIIIINNNIRTGGFYYEHFYRNYRSHSLHFSYFPHVHSLFNLLYGAVYHYPAFEDTGNK
nr:MAG TPA: hypothetical protein [Caudoviricetes sp.]